MLVYKLLEFILRDKIIKHLTENNAITWICKWKIMFNQFCNLLQSFEDGRLHLTKGVGQISFLDFQKAFEIVLHCRLIHKLSACGINTQLLRWLSDFLYS